jgi:hypothetical protein
MDTDTPFSLWPSAEAAPKSDVLMTEDRSEQKILLAGEYAQGLVRRIGSHFDRHFPPGALRLPGAQQFATTIYFDTASRHLFGQAAVATTSVKLRAREYYTLDPSMVQVAKRLEQMVRFDPVLWFELKHKQGHQVQKQRFGVPKHDVPGFLQDGRITEEMVDVQSERHGEKARQAMLDITKLCGLYGESFCVDCIVNYRRVAWQDPAGTLRLTLDRQVGFFDAPEDIWTRRFALIRETLGPARGVLDRAILEIKSRGELPDWLAEAIEEAHGERLDFSKFVSASRAVNG